MKKVCINEFGNHRLSSSERERMVHYFDLRILGFLYSFRVSDDMTTETLLSAIESAATQGGSNIPVNGKSAPAAIGMAMTL